MKVALFRTLFLGCIWALTFRLEAQEDQIKKGWNFGGLPVVAFDSDLGFQAGALVNLFHYGDGSNYPAYDHSFYFEGSYFTKGSGIFRFFYDSPILIKNVQTSIDITYMPDQALNFMGFNGYESVIQFDWSENGSPAYRTRMFYKHKRLMWRMKLDLSGSINELKYLKWLGGIEGYHVTTSSVDIDRLNRGKSEEDKLPSTSEEPGLFEKYQQWGLITEEEKDGGWFVAFKAGLMYDSRDNQANPNKGIWSEMMLVAAPQFISNMESSFLKISLRHRQYLGIIYKKLTFAYRIAFQGNLAGYTPFYAQPIQYYSMLRGAFNDGLGGAKTIRGMIRNRVVGDGILFGNLELRWKFYKFFLWDQNFYLGLNGFVDGGKVVQFIETADTIDEIDFGTEQKEWYFNPGAEQMHITYGMGIRLAMNQNFIVAVDYGRTTNAQDGDAGLYIGLNYLF